MSRPSTKENDSTRLFLQDYLSKISKWKGGNVKNARKISSPIFPVMAITIEEKALGGIKIREEKEKTEMDIIDSYEKAKDFC